MSLLANRMSVLRQDRRGVTALEYGLIAAVVVVVGLAGFSAIGDELFQKFNQVGAAVGDDSTGASADAGANQ